MKTRHIGIVACSAEGAALCYRTICAEGGPAHPEVSMHTHPLADYVDRLERGDVHGVGELMLASTAKLAAVGADFLICPDNTIHQAFPYLLGTRWLVDSRVYPEKLEARGLQCVRPSAEERDEIHRVIIEELVYGVFKPEGIAFCT